METRWSQVLLAATGLVVVLTAVGAHVRQRNQFVAEHGAIIAETQHKLASIARPPARIAFWTESSQDFMGEVSFHFWGNYRYANSHFDSVLLRWFPQYTLFRLRNVRRLAYDSLDAAAVATVGSRYGRIGDLYWRFRHRLFQDREHYSRIGGMLSGGDSVAIIAIAFPEEEMDELPPMSEEELIARVGRWFDVPSVSHESVGGVPWLFFRFHSPRRIRGGRGAQAGRP